MSSSKYLVSMRTIKRNADRNPFQPLLENIRVLDVRTMDENGLTTVRSVPYFKLPNDNSYPLDLSEGYESYVHRHYYTSKEQFRILQQFLKWNPSILNGNDPETTKVFCRRHTLITILTALINYEGFSINVTKYNGMIFMNDSVGDCVLDEIKTELFSYHYKLLQHCLVEKPGSSPKTDEPANGNIETVTFTNASFGKYNLYYTSDVVGLDSDKELRNREDLNEINKHDFVMVKTKRRGVLNTVFLLLRALLSKVHTVYFGNMDDNGVIDQPLEKRSVAELEEELNLDPNIIWKELYCVLDMMLSKVDNIFCPHTFFQFTFDPVTKDITYKIFENSSEHPFLEEDFIAFLQTFAL